MDYLLEVNHLKTYFYGSEKQEIPAVDDVSFKVKQGCLLYTSRCV